MRQMIDAILEFGQTESLDQFILRFGCVEDEKFQLEEYKRKLRILSKLDN